MINLSLNQDGFVYLEDEIIFEDGGANSFLLIESDIVITWRGRTKNPYGYGRLPYGADTDGYGGGNISDIKQFKIEIYKTSNMSLLRQSTINISDNTNPDADAIYTYTKENNKSDNSGLFETNLTVKVYQIAQDDTISPAESVVVFALSTF